MSPILNLFGGGGGKSPQPKPLPSQPAVDPAQIADQQRKAAETQMAASQAGRASTILAGTDPANDVLGGSVSKQLTAA